MPAEPLYQAVANQISDMITRNVLRTGMRAPSVRAFAARNEVSMTTVLQAYRLLEDRGVLKARPKSGFYVTSRTQDARKLPAESRPPQQATPVVIGNSVSEILTHAANPAYAPLGCAIPSVGLLAADKLDRHLARCARTLGRSYNVYTEPLGDADLRQVISERALRIGHAVSSDNIIITNGCTEALSVALCATTKPGDTVAIESPTYFGLLQILEARGLRVLELPTDPTHGIDVTALAKALKKRRIAACLLSSSFNNPLGCCMSDAVKLEILKLLGQHNVPLIEDDIYGDIYFSDDRPRPFAALAKESDVILCSSFSKTIAPGYRIGWIASNTRRDELQIAKFSTSLCGPALTQKAMADFLGSGGYDNHLRRIRRTFFDNIERMRFCIDKSFPLDTRITSPDGGFVLWIEMPDTFDCSILFQRAMRERICFAPGHLFTATTRYRNCMRLSCGHEWDYRIERSVERLGELAGELIAET